MEIVKDQLVLLRNNKRNDRKGGKFTPKWIRPYTVIAISEKGATTLKNAARHVLKTKYNVSQLKPYHEPEPSKFWDVDAPDKIIEVILVMTIKQSSHSFPDHECETFNSMRQTCRR